MSDIIYVDNDRGAGDWCGLYLDGMQIADGHNVSTHTWLQLLRKLGHEVTEASYDDEEMEDMGARFPVESKYLPKPNLTGSTGSTDD